MGAAHSAKESLGDSQITKGSGCPVRRSVTPADTVPSATMATETIKCIDEYARATKQLLDAVAQAVTGQPGAANNAISMMQGVVACDEKLQASLGRVAQGQAVQQRISAVDDALKAKSQEIQSLAGTLRSAETKLEEIIAVAKRKLECATKASDRAPAASDVIALAQRLAFTTDLPRFPQKMDCRHRRPWPTETEFRLSTNLFAQDPAAKPIVVVGSTDAPTAPDLRLAIDDRHEGGLSPVKRQKMSPKVSPQMSPQTKPTTAALSIYTMDESDSGSEEDEEEDSE